MPQEALETLLAGSTIKGFTRGTHRSCPPRQTVERLQPALARCGITRIADVTGLDRLGIPVVMVVRPNARSVSVAQGKGIDLDAARASGIMEAIENYYAERPSLPVIRAAFSTFDADPGVLDPVRLPHRPTAPCARDLELAWVAGFDLSARQRIWVPLDAVHVDYTDVTGDGGAVLDVNSNGLASGNTLAEAVLHGLCEVIESDAWALEWRRRSAARRSPRIDPSGASPLVDGLLARCESAGVLLEVRDLTSDIDVPVFEAMIAERGNQRLPPLAPAHGLGCHPDAIVAICRAITEAAQVRLGLIAGSRDDLRSEDYPSEWPPSPRSEVDTAAVPFSSSAPRAQATIEQDIVVVLDRLGARGIHEVIGVDLSPADGSAAIVRILVPDLEAYPGLPNYTPGPRATSIAGATSAAVAPRAAPR